MARRPSALRCVYCRAPATTRDHIPPKCLFAKNNRGDLIWVPACRKCNGAFSKDDEYFGQALILDDEVADFPDVAEGTDRVISTLQHNAKKYEALARSLDFAEDWRGGIFRGIKPAYHINTIRLCRTVSRTVKGLFWRETNKNLPLGHVVITFSDHRPIPTIPTLPSVNKLIESCRKNEVTSVGNGVFDYSHNVDDPQKMTYWITRFYEKTVFCSYTIPIDDIPQNWRGIAF